LRTRHVRLQLVHPRTRSTRTHPPTVGFRLPVCYTHVLRLVRFCTHYCPLPFGLRLPGLPVYTFTVAFVRCSYRTLRSLPHLRLRLFWVRSTPAGFTAHRTVHTPRYARYWMRYGWLILVAYRTFVWLHAARLRFAFCHVCSYRLRCVPTMVARAPHWMRLRGCLPRLRLPVCLRSAFCVPSRVTRFTRCVGSAACFARLRLLHHACHCGYGYTLRWFTPPVRRRFHTRLHVYRVTFSSGSHQFTLVCYYVVHHIPGSYFAFIQFYYRFAVTTFALHYGYVTVRLRYVRHTDLPHCLRLLRSVTRLYVLIYTTFTGCRLRSGA